MSRPMKTGLRYFPLDVNFFRDSGIRRLYRRFGAVGPALYIYLLCRVYEGKGFYCEYDNDLIDDICDDLGFEPEDVREMIDFLAEKDLISEKLLKKYGILSSHGIQMRYQECLRNHKRQITVPEDYWLLREEETMRFVVPLGSRYGLGDYEGPDTVYPPAPAAIIPENSALIPENSALIPESSENDSGNKIKENKTKENKIKPDETENENQRKENHFSEKGKGSAAVAAADGTDEKNSLRESVHRTLEQHYLEAFEQGDDGHADSVRRLLETMGYAIPSEWELLRRLEEKEKEEMSVEIGGS